MAFGINLGGGSSRSRSFIDPKQQPFLDFLRGGSQALALEQAGGLQSLFGLSEGLVGQGQEFLGGLQQNPFLQNLAGMSAPNPELVSRQVDQLGADIGRNLQQNILPGIQSQAIGLGGAGGARAGIAEGMASQAAVDALTRGATDLTAADQSRAQQAAIAGGGLQAQSMLGGLQGLGSIFNLAASPFAAQFSPFMNMAQIVGGPTVLNKSKAKSFSGGFGL